MREELKTALRTAEAVLERRTRILEVVQGGVEKLSGLIISKVQTNREFRRLESQAAIGEPAPDLEKARKRAADAESALQEGSLKLRGLRAQLAEQGTAFVRSYDELAAQLPFHEAEMVKGFNEEYQAGLAAWQDILSRRVAIERLIGKNLEGLSDPIPTPAATEVHEAMAVPHKTLADLAAAIQAIAGKGRLADRQLQPTGYYDPQAIYVLIGDRNAKLGLPHGCFVTDASFFPGGLLQLIEIQEARPLLDRDGIRGAADALRKADLLTKLETEAQLERSNRALYGSNDENLKKSGKVVEPEIDRTSQIRENARRSAEIAGRSIGASDPEYASR
jgi:hypothetical protein